MPPTVETPEETTPATSTEPEVDESDPSVDTEETTPATSPSVDTEENWQPATSTEPVQVPITINQVPDNTLYQVVKKKQGRGKGGIQLIFRPPLNTQNPFANYMKMVGAEPWFLVVIEDVLRPACVAAQKEATGEDGKISLEKFASAFAGYFTAPDRGGSGIRQMRKRFDELSKEVTPFFMVQCSPDEAENLIAQYRVATNSDVESPADNWSAEEMAHWKSVLLEWSSLNAKINDPAKGKVRNPRLNLLRNQ